MATDKIHILLDSNIYRHNPQRNNLEFKAIAKLCRSGSIQLHIPFVIEKEFSSYQLIEQTTLLNQCISLFNNLQNKGLHGSLTADAAALENGAKRLLRDVRKNGDDFGEWADSLGAQRHSLNLAQAQLALNAYFEGTPPLKEPKIRKDIPDSFIFQSTKDILKESPGLRVVIHDRKLREAVSSELNVTCYENLKEFINEEAIQDLLREHTFMEKFPEGLSRLGKILSSKSGDLVGNAICGMSIESMSGEEDATIVGYGEMDDIQFEFEKATYYGDGLIGVPFVASIEASYRYFIFKSDYYCMEEPLPSVSDHNKHYFEAEGCQNVAVHGVLKFALDIHSFFAPENPEDIVTDINIDEISFVDLENSKS